MEQVAKRIRYSEARATQRCGSRIVSDILDHISVTFNTIASLDVIESPIF